MPPVKKSEKQPANHLSAVDALATAGILLPFLLLSMLLGSHGGMDDARFYGTTQHLFAAIFGAGAMTLLASAAGHYRPGNRPLRFAAIATAAISIAICLTIIWFIYVPQLEGGGDVPPQLIITGSYGGRPSMALVFYTEIPSKNTIVLDGEAISESAPSNKHWFDLELGPGRNHSYSVNGQAPVEFRTPATDTLRFAASGDPHSGASVSGSNPLLTLVLGSGGVGSSREDLTSKMYGIIKSEGYDQMYLLGDAVQFGFSDAMWKDAFGLAAPTTSTIPIAYLPGNHDAMFGGIGLYKRYLCPDGSGGSQCLMKHIRNGNIDIILIDLEWGTQLYTQEEREWLENELASVPQDHWLIVMSHTFYYSSGSYKDGWAWYDNTETIGALVPLFEKNHVDLVLSGHKHHAEVLKKNGITYAVIGAFGGLQDDERTYVSPASVWYKSGAYAFADVNIGGGNATLAIRDYNNTILYETCLQNN